MPATVIQDDNVRATEEWLREEVRANRALLVQTLQFGLTLIIAVHTSLYYVRRDVQSHHLQKQQHAAAIDYVKQGVPEKEAEDRARINTPNKPIHIVRWSIGTLILWFVAYFFYFITKYLASIQRHYKGQLEKLNPGIFSDSTPIQDGESAELP